jgi:hypothetical protein
MSPPIEVHDARYHLADMPPPDNQEMYEQSERPQLFKPQTSDLQMPLPHTESHDFRYAADEGSGRVAAAKEDLKREIVLVKRLREEAKGAMIAATLKAEESAEAMGWLQQHNWLMANNA